MDVFWDVDISCNNRIEEGRLASRLANVEGKSTRVDSDITTFYVEDQHA